LYEKIGFEKEPIKFMMKKRFWFTYLFV
jgi:hypothetical protein